jgi:hypothetical protein
MKKVMKQNFGLETEAGIDASQCQQLESSEQLTIGY